MNTSEKLIPIGPNLLIKRMQAETVSAGGIFLPTAEKPIDRGEVVSVGTGSLTKSGNRVPCECSVGDVVYWSKYQGTEVTVRGERYMLVREDDVVCREST